MPIVILASLAAGGAARATEPTPWRLLSGTPAFPTPIEIPMAVYDPVRHRVLVIDVGWHTAPLVVRAFDPGLAPRWTDLPIAGTAPPMSYLASLAYDPTRDRLLVVGAFTSTIEVWAVNLSGTAAWEKVATSGDPPGRYGHSAIVDPAHDQLILFGGLDHAGSETWSLSLASGVWSRIATSGAQPPPREGHGALYDPEHDRMLVFGGHWEDGTRIFRNDLWQLTLGDSAGWSEIVVAGPLPGPRSAFGTVYDPLRKRMLVHGGVNVDSGVEPDDLWALSLDGAPAWAPIVPEEPLQGRSYSADVYDVLEDRILSCGGANYPQCSSLPLASPVRWTSLLPETPLPAPSEHKRSAVVFDSRRDRFLVIGGEYSPADSNLWAFHPEGERRWRAIRATPAPHTDFFLDEPWVAVYDSLGDRILEFDGWQVWSSPAEMPGAWTALGPHLEGGEWPHVVGTNAGIAVDTRRNRLLLTGGYSYYPHSAGFSLDGVWSFSLGPEPAWNFVGTMPISSYGHTAIYDPNRDRLVLVGGEYVNDLGRTFHHFGAVVWSTPLDSVLDWAKLSVDADAGLLGPPLASVAHDARTGTLFVGRNSMLRMRSIDHAGTWLPVPSATPAPVISEAIAYDPIREQLLALFARRDDTTSVQAWALALGPPSVSVMASDRTAQGVTIRLRSVRAWNRAAAVERFEEGSDWQVIASLTFAIDGLATVTDATALPGHNYSYRVSVTEGDTTWRSGSLFMPDAGSLQLALHGARPNPSVGAMRLFFSLPASGPASLEVFDVHGRKTYSRDVGAAGPGIHFVQIEESAAWSAGVYYVRLRRGRDSRSARVVLLP